MFKKYSGIENSYQVKTIDYIKERGADSGLFYVTEKIHGANFSFITDGETVQDAKRNNILEDSDNFYNRKSLNLTEKIKNLWGIVNGLYNCDFIQVYGELFGGSYPHELIEPSGKPSRVQKGVFYHPENMWLAFDIRVDGVFFIDSKDKYSLFKDAGILHVPRVFDGSFEQCLNFKNDFQTNIPDIYGLPPIENNICEGVVITPHIEKRIGNFRVILKSKNELFKEKASRKEKKPQMEVSEILNTAILEGERYVTENRFNNVISKEGEFNHYNQFGKMVGLFISDIMIDFSKENKSILNNLEKNERKFLQKQLSKKAVNIIRTYAQENIISAKVNDEKNS